MTLHQHLPIYKLAVDLLGLAVDLTRNMPRAAQEEIGPGAYFFRDRKTGERFGLKDLQLGAGRHDEPAPSCSFFCEIAEQEYSA